MTIAKFINEVGFKVREGDVKKVNDSIKSIKSTATKLLGAIGIGFSLTKINALVEEFGAANKQIKSSVGEMENMDAVQGQVLQKANAARLAYTDMAGYGRSGFQCSSINPKPFAIVYYAENKKRLVPMDGIEKVER